MEKKIQPLDESVIALIKVLPYTLLNKFISLHNSLCNKDGYNGEFIYQSEKLAAQLAVSRSTVSKWINELCNLKCKDGKERKMIYIYVNDNEQINRYRLNACNINELNTTAQHYELTYEYGTESRTKEKKRPTKTQTIKKMIRELIDENTPYS